MTENASALISLAIFAVVSSITPGPNNFMVMASSAAFGWQRTMPHVAGITIGFAIMISSVVLGLGVVLETYPQIITFVQISGAAWLFWLAWQLGRSAFSSVDEGASASEEQRVSRPLTFVEGALFQWVNPKAWTMALGASAAYSGISSEPFSRAVLMALTFVLVAPPCLSLWALAGRGLSALTTKGVSARWMSLLMAALVALSAISMVVGI